MYQVFLRIDEIEHKILKEPEERFTAKQLIDIIDGTRLLSARSQISSNKINNSQEIIKNKITKDESSILFLQFPFFIMSYYWRMIYAHCCRTIPKGLIDVSPKWIHL